MEKLTVEQQLRLDCLKMASDYAISFNRDDRIMSTEGVIQLSKEYFLIVLSGVK